MPRYHVSLDGDACISGLARSGCRSDCTAQKLRRDATPVIRPVTTCTWHSARGAVLYAQKNHDTHPCPRHALWIWAIGLEGTHWCQRQGAEGAREQRSPWAEEQRNSRGGEEQKRGRAAKENPMPFGLPGD